MVRKTMLIVFILLVYILAQPLNVHASVMANKYCGGNMVLSIADLNRMYPNHKLSTSYLNKLGAGPLDTPSLPQRVINTVYLPPVKSQGSQNSCVGWASTYYLWTYMQAWMRGITSPSSTWAFSPAFTYNLINKGDNSGTYFTDALNVLTTLGAPHWSTMPYDSNDYTTWPSSVAFQEASNYRARNWYWLYIGNESGIEEAKSLLAKGYVLLYGIHLWDSFYHIGDYGNIYSVHSKSGSYRGGHAVVIVGYDDTLDTPDGPGAFRIVNSWGTYWGDNGYFWMTYEAVKDSNLSQMWAIVVFPRSDYTPQIQAYLRISHSHRGEIIGHGGIKLGVGDPNSPQWERSFLDFYIGRYADLSSYQAHPFPDDYLIFDLSDSLSYLTVNDSPYLPVYLVLEDRLSNGNTGILQEFKVVIDSEYLHTERYASAHDVPIPEGNKLILTVNIPFANYTNMTPGNNSLLNQSWIYVGVGSLLNITMAILDVDNVGNFTMEITDSKYAYYNVTTLPNGNYTYRVRLVLNGGSVIELPLMHVMITGSHIPKDVNGDGRITAVDALLYLRFAVGLNISPYHLDPVLDDVTGDGRITVADAIKVLRIALGIEGMD